MGRGSRQCEQEREGGEAGPVEGRDLREVHDSEDDVLPGPRPVGVPRGDGNPSSVAPVAPVTTW